MKPSTRLIVILVVLFSLVLAACQMPAAPVAPQEPAQSEEAAPAPEPADSADDPESSDEELAEATDEEATDEEATDEEATDEETADAEAEAPAEAVAAADAPASESAEGDAGEAVTESVASTYVIDQGQSQARFYIDEVLLGADKRVEGVTSMVEGSVTIDMADLSQTSISEIRINARDFKTDSDRRNGAIQRRILRASDDAYQYITFVPTAIEGLPASAAAGETVEFNVVGDLTVVDVTRSETFAMSVTANDDGTISGTGSTTVLYKDYKLRIPSVPVVASVEDEVLLEIEFVAVAE
ncbi:MAG: YceI family protein [Chloroflexota bacterium]